MPARPLKKAVKPKASPTPPVEKTTTSKGHTPREGKKPAESTKAHRIRIRLSAFDHTVLDESAAKIIDTAQRSGAIVHGPVPLPTQIKKFTLMRSTFVKKDARDQFEMRVHRRLIDLTETTYATVDALQNLSLPSGVDIEIKMGKLS